MSVLLEALKKAAEDKKKALEGSTETKGDLSQKAEVIPKNNVLERGLNKKKPDISLQEKTEESGVKIELSLDSTPPSDKVDNLKSPNDKASSTSESSVPEVQQASLSLKLDSSPTIKKEALKTTIDSVDSKEVTDPVSNTLKLAVDDSSLIKPASNDEEPPRQQKTTHVEEAKQEEPKLNLSLSEPPLAENIQEKTPQTLQKESELKASLIEEPPLIKIEEEHVEASPAVLVDEALLKESSLSTEKEPVTKVLDLGLVKEEKSSVEPPPINLDKKKLKEDEESYKWSLDALPGYLGFGKKQSKKNKKASEKSLNPILVSGALSEGPPKEKSFKLALILLIFLLVIGIFFYGVFYYQTQYEDLEQRMNKYNLVKTPIVVKKVVQLDEKNNQVMVEANASAKDTSSSQEPFDSNQTERRVLEADLDFKNNLSAEESPENKGTLSQEAPIKKTIANSKPQAPLVKPVMVENATKDKVKSVDVPLSANTRYPSNLNKTQNTKKAVVVVHSEEDVLFEAYSSYEKGNLVQAQTDFESVLSMNPQNEFALIGLGNIFASKQQYLDAMSYYQQALSAQPSSLNAFEAIANISGHVDLNREWKFALLNMLQDHPKSSTLQYALGNLYATEQDWLAAQEAYFQAASLEPDNADYLVNLAVSLDQLGKYKSAARYYTEALAFVDVQPVNFNEVQVKNRLIFIRQFMAGRN